MILKIWVKSKFFVWQTRFYNLSTGKKDKKIHIFWSTHFFENVLLLSIPRYSLWIPSLDDILLENFTFPNSDNLVEDLISWKKGFEIFLIDHYTGDIGNKNIAGKY